MVSFIESKWRTPCVIKMLGTLPNTDVGQFYAFYYVLVLHAQIHHPNHLAYSIYPPPLTHVTGTSLS